VPCIRRFGLPDEENPKGSTGKPKCGGRNRTKGESPTAVSGARAAEGGEAYTRCYAKLLTPNKLKYLGDKLRKSLWISRKKEDGTIRKVSGAVRGNRTEAFRREKKTDLFMEGADFKPECSLFITLGKQYKKTHEGMEKSWKETRKCLAPFLRKLKAAGMIDYITVLEAYAAGGCHVHVLCKWNRKFKTFERKGKLRITNKKIKTLIENAWEGTVDIQRMRDEDVKGYVAKYLGKSSHIEDALKRALRDWEKEGDEDHKETDCKKLWGCYWSTKLKIRQYTTSRASPEQKEKAKAAQAEKAAQAAALINEVNNPTGHEESKLVREMILPKWITFHKDFEPYNEKVDPCGREKKLLDDFEEWVDTVNDGQWGKYADFRKWRENKTGGKKNE